jgi:hypothetical protein
MIRLAVSCVALAIVTGLTGCATTPEVPPLPTETLWGYTAPAQASSAELVITFDRVACNTVRARYVRQVSAPIYLAECRQLTVAPGDGYWIVPTADLSGYLGATTLEECEAIGRRQSRDFGQSGRVCQAVQVEFR